MNKRLLSIDVLRGMTIFFMIIVNTPGSWEYVYAPLLHAPWDGLTPTDLVFPFFVFIVGLSMSISFRKYQTSERTEWVIKVLKRTALIFLVGLLLNYYPFFNKSLDNLRIFGVLQRIALAYGIGSLLIIFVKDKFLPYALGVVLVGYYLLLKVFGGNAPLSLEDNAVRMIDLFLVGENHVYGGYGIPFDPEGLLSAIPSAGTVLFGYLVGKVMQTKEDVLDKCKALIPYGIGGVVLGVIWNFAGFPINKPIWSSSYVLVCGGLATLLLVFLIYVIDVKGSKGWTKIFQVFGLNPLISYVLSGLVVKTFFLIKIGDQNLYVWLYSHVFQPVLGNYNGSLIQAITYTMFIWLFAYWLFKNNKVIKL